MVPIGSNFTRAISGVSAAFHGKAPPFSVQYPYFAPTTRNMDGPSRAVTVTCPVRVTYLRDSALCH